jgi:hypothetical protein
MQVRRAKTNYIANEPRLNKLLRSQRRRKKPVLQRHLARAAKTPQRCLHAGQILLADSQRFIAVDVFTSRHRCQQLFCVLAVWRADVDDLNIFS